MHEISASHSQSHDSENLHPILDFNPFLVYQHQELDQFRDSVPQCQKWELLPARTRKNFLKKTTLKIKIYSKNASVENPWPLITLTLSGVLLEKA